MDARKRKSASSGAGNKVSQNSKLVENDSSDEDAKLGDIKRKIKGEKIEPTPDAPSKLDKEPVKKKKKSSKEKKIDVPPPDGEHIKEQYKHRPLPERHESGDLLFKDHPEFRPNMTPKEVLQAGSFGGTYFRDIYSSVLGENCKDAWKELPPDWLEGLDIKTKVASQTYRESVNLYKAKCGGDLKMWEESGWIKKQDPYGWFQWYCRFYQGRRTKDDGRQIDRWLKCAGTKGRWRNNLVTKIFKSNAKYTDKSVSPVVRQVLLHWGYKLTEEHYLAGAKAASKRVIGK